MEFDLLMAPNVCAIRCVWDGETISVGCLVLSEAAIAQTPFTTTLHADNNQQLSVKIPRVNAFCTYGITLYATSIPSEFTETSN